MSDDGLPAVTPLLLRALAPRRRPDWRTAAPIRVSAPRVWLDPGRVDQFLAVCGGAEPPSVPLTFPYALVTPLHVAVLADPAFPLAPLGLVHRAERIERRRTIAVGTRVDVTCTARDFRPAPGGVLFDLHTVLAQGGEPIWTSTSTVGARDGALAPARGPIDVPETDREAPFEAPWWVGVRYGSVSRNLDPIHTSWVGSRLLGVPGPIAHGMWTVARALAEVGEPTGPARLDVRFRSPLRLPARGRVAWRREGGSTDVVVWAGGARPVLVASVVDTRSAAGHDAGTERT